jgi:hypothetical protein
MDETSPGLRTDSHFLPSRHSISPLPFKRDRISADERNILRILSEAEAPLFPSQITERVNFELGSGAPYSMTEVAMLLVTLSLEVDQLPDGRWASKRRMD